MPLTIGRPLRRLEDEHLITGRGRYAADIKLDRVATAAFLRSSLPHARIASVDTRAARDLPGVLGAWTAADLPEAQRTLSDFVPSNMTVHARPLLAHGEVNYVGDAVAMVVAEDPYQAQDALEAISLDLDPLPAVADVLSASADGAPPVHARMKSNLTGEAVHEYGDLGQAFGRASVVVRGTLSTARVCGAAMEPRAVTASLDPKSQVLTVWASTQAVFFVRDQICEQLGLDKEKVVVLAEDVGGGFGAKGATYPEEVLVALAALELRRPVRWVAGRSEDTATTVQAHGTVLELELAASREGKLLGLRGRVLHDIGAYAGSGSGQPALIVPHLVSAYVLPAFRVEASLVYTNTVPTGFVRGGGRPLGNFGIERMVDLMAHELGLDPAELRRRNLVQPDQMPYDTRFPAGRGTYVYDGGDYPRLLEMALKQIGYEDLRKQERQDGRLLGLGIACCVESSGFGRGEPARLRLETDGTAHLFVGSTPQGQGHLTIASQVLAERLGWPLERIRVTAGDTRGVDWALLTAGSRTAVQVGNAVSLAAKAMRKKLLEQAAESLEADPQDLILEDGVVGVRGAPSKAMPAGDLVPAEGLEVAASFDPHRPLAFSSGCHAAAVAVDPETGSVDVLRYVIVHDTGKPINALLVEGQMHGGFAHGLGYALFEEAVYDPDGAFRSASFLDYAIPSPPELGTEPELLHIETPTDHNPEGFKGAGESGTIPVPAAIANAVEDALRQVRPEVVVDRIPITPQRVFDLLTR